MEEKKDLMNGLESCEKQSQSTLVAKSFEDFFDPAHIRQFGQSAESAEVFAMLKVLQYIKETFPIWAEREKNWKIHKNQISHLYSIDSTLREAYRAIFKSLRGIFGETLELHAGKVENGALLSEVLECFDLLKTPEIAVSELWKASIGDSYENDEPGIRTHMHNFISMDRFSSGMECNEDEYELGLNGSYSKELENAIFPETTQSNVKEQEHVEKWPFLSDRRAPTSPKIGMLSVNEMNENISLDALGYSETVERQRKVLQAGFARRRKIPKRASCQVACEASRCSLFSDIERFDSSMKRPKRYTRKVKSNLSGLLQSNLQVEEGTSTMTSTSSQSTTDTSKIQTEQLSADALAEKIATRRLVTSTTIISERSLPPKYQSGIKGVVWNRHRQVWEATWKASNGRRIWVSFRADKYGFDEAKKLAIHNRIIHSSDPADKELYVSILTEDGMLASSSMGISGDSGSGETSSLTENSAAKVMTQCMAEGNGSGSEINDEVPSKVFLDCLPGGDSHTVLPAKDKSAANHDEVPALTALASQPESITRGIRRMETRKRAKLHLASLKHSRKTTAQAADNNASSQLVGYEEENGSDFDTQLANRTSKVSDGHPVEGATSLYLTETLASKKGSKRAFTLVTK